MLFASGAVGGAGALASLAADGGVLVDVDTTELSEADSTEGEGGLSGAGAAAPAEMGGVTEVTAGFGAWGRAGAEMISAAVCLGGSGGVGERAEDSSGSTMGAGGGGSGGAPALLPTGSLWVDAGARESAEEEAFEELGPG